MRSKFWSVSATAIVAIAWLTATAAALAQATTSFNLPAQSLADSLRAVAGQTNSNILFDRSLVAGISAKALQAQLSMDEALKHLLAGTGLTYRNSDDKTVMIVPESTSTSSSTSLLVPAERGDDERAARLQLAQNHEAEQKVLAQAGSQPDGTEKSSPTENNAAPALEEIVVTAEKREESIQTLPIAISAYSAQTLATRGIDGLESLPQLAPSLQVAERPGQEMRIAIRGISTEFEGNSGEPSVSFAQDGMPYAQSSLYLGDFFDVERVEVLRGPQGTISGRNATAGAINIHSNRPTDEFEGRVKATVGNYERWGVESYLSGPLAGDRLLGRVAVRTDQADGWVTNTLRDKKLGTLDKVQARASFLARLSDNFEAHLILEGLRDRSTYLNHVFVDEGRLRPDTPTLTSLGIPDFDRDSRTVELNQRPNLGTDQYQTMLRLAWELGPSAQLTAVTGYVDRHQEFEFDNDGTLESGIVHHEVFDDSRQVSQEVTLTMDLSDRLDMLVGALYLDLDQESFVDLAVPPVSVSVVGPSDLKLTSWAGYTQWRYRLTDKVRLTAGTRYTHDTKDLSIRRTIFIGDPPFLELPQNNAGDHSWNAWTPRFAVDYAPSDDLTLYANVSRGFKSGGVQPRGLFEPIGTFEPEFLWNYEAGVKANWLDGRVKTALTGFYMDYTDLQAVLTFFDPEAGTIRGEITNAESATIKGVEVEFEAKLTNRLRFALAGTWLDATYDELHNVDELFPELGEPLPEAPGGPNFRDLSGNRLVRAPEWQFNVSGEYRAPLGVPLWGSDLEGVLRASYAWQDQIFFDIFNRESNAQDAYGLVNLFGALETTDGRWELSVFARNLTDRDYTTHKFSTLGLLPLPYSRHQIGEPRRYGVNLAYRF